MSTEQPVTELFHYLSVRRLITLTKRWSAETHEPARVATEVIALATHDLASPMEAEDVLALEDVLPRPGKRKNFDWCAAVLAGLASKKSLPVYDVLRNYVYNAPGTDVAHGFALGGHQEALDVSFAVSGKKKALFPGRIPAQFADPGVDVSDPKVLFSFGASHSVFGPDFAAFGRATFFSHIHGEALWITAPPTPHNLLAFSRFYSPESRPAPQCAVQFLRSAELVRYRCMDLPEAVIFPPFTIVIIVANRPAIRASMSFIRSGSTEDFVAVLSALSDWKHSIHGDAFFAMAIKIQRAAADSQSASTTATPQHGRQLRSRGAPTSFAPFHRLK
jgi:hypothetical protein